MAIIMAMCTVIFYNKINSEITVATHSHNNRHSTQTHFDAKPLPVTLMVLPVKVMFLSMRAL